MNTINGESEPISVNEGYANSGGIALFSAGDGGTVSGGSSEEGSYNSIFRIYWTITYDAENNTYTGGITGTSWLLTEKLSPFYGATESDIWEKAQDGNLSEFFSPWNSNTLDEQKVEFLGMLTGGCYRLSLGE